MGILHKFLFLDADIIITQKTVTPITFQHLVWWHFCGLRLSSPNLKGQRHLRKFSYLILKSPSVCHSFFLSFILSFIPLKFSSAVLHNSIRHAPACRNASPSNFQLLPCSMCVLLVAVLIVRTEKQEHKQNNFVYIFNWKPEEYGLPCNCLQLETLYQSSVPPTSNNERFFDTKDFAPDSLMRIRNNCAKDDEVKTR